MRHTGTPGGRMAFVQMRRNLTAGRSREGDYGPSRRRRRHDPYECRSRSSAHVFSGRDEPRALKFSIKLIIFVKILLKMYFFKSECGFPLEVPVRRRYISKIIQPQPEKNSCRSVTGKSANANSSTSPPSGWLSPSSSCRGAGPPPSSTPSCWCSICSANTPTPAMCR